LQFGKTFSQFWSILTAQVRKWLSVCPHSKRKMAWAINTKLCARILYSSRSACIDSEVKRS